MSAKARQCQKASRTRKAMQEAKYGRNKPCNLVTNMAMTPDELQAHLQRRAHRINKKRPYDTRGTRKQNVYA